VKRTAIGKMNERVALQSRVEAADGVGGVTRTWADVATVWAEVTPRVGVENMENGRINAAQTATFTIRTRDDVNETWRLMWRGDVWNIRRIMRGGNRPQFMDMDAERGVSE
jgi:SPP1 family predicted phage head-tail adaptor